MIKTFYIHFIYIQNKSFGQLLDISFEINLILTSSSTCIIILSATAKTLAIADTKSYIPAVTLSTQEDIELLVQSK